MKRENLASTLEKIADDEKNFYSGDLSTIILKSLREFGSIITKKDFSDYEVVERSPLEGKYKGKKIITAGVPAR